MPATEESSNWRKILSTAWLICLSLAERFSIQRCACSAVACVLPKAAPISGKDDFVIRRRGHGDLTG